jgi:hypothetical protein
MAEERGLIVNALLCFTLYSLKKHPRKIVSSIINDFYSQDIISEAKERLMNDIENLKTDKWIRPPVRRGDNRLKRDLEDILAQVTLIDELGLLARLPVYVVHNLDDIPMIRMEHGEFAVLVSKLDKLNDGLTELHNMRQQTSTNSGNTMLSPRYTKPVALSHSLPAIDENIRRIRLSVVDSDNDGSSDAASGGEWMTQRSKKRKSTGSPVATNSTVGNINVNMQSIPSYSAALSSTAGNKSSINNTTLNVARANYEERPSNVKIIGRSTNSSSSSTFKSARPIIRKAVFGLYNVDKHESAETLRDYVQNVLNVPVISCFETNLQRPNDFNKSFRLCINAKDISALLNEESWADGLVIKEWRFTQHARPIPARLSSPSRTQLASEVMESSDVIIVAESSQSLTKTYETLHCSVTDSETNAINKNGCE